MTDAPTVPILPDGYQFRAPALGDAAAVLAILHACELDELGKAQVDLEDILGDWRRPGVDIARDGTFVVDAAGRPVAYGEYFAGRAEGNVLPDHAGRGIGVALAGWIQHRAREVDARFVRQVVPMGATTRRSLLEASGYEQSDTAWELRIDLPIDEPGPRRLPGIEVDDFRPGVEDAAVWQVIEDAFGAWPSREPQTLAAWRATTLDRAGFEPWMLRVARAGDDVVGAAYCIDIPDDSEAWLHQLAVQADRRGTGIGTLLLADACREFAARGRRALGLGTDSRTGALDLYVRFGMRVASEHVGYRLDLPASS